MDQQRSCPYTTGDAHMDVVSTDQKQRFEKLFNNIKQDLTELLLVGKRIQRKPVVERR
jgi:hypothetical protein